MKTKTFLTARERQTTDDVAIALIVYHQKFLFADFWREGLEQLQNIRIPMSPPALFSLFPTINFSIAIAFCHDDSISSFCLLNFPELLLCNQFCWTWHWKAQKKSTLINHDVQKAFFVLFWEVIRKKLPIHSINSIVAEASQLCEENYRLGGLDKKRARFNCRQKWQFYCLAAVF